MAIVISTSTPRGFVLSITVTDGHDRTNLNQEISELLNSAELSELHKGDEIQLWIENAEDNDNGLIASTGFSPYRDLVQLRCSLPVQESRLTTRSFELGVDEEDFLLVNRRAFAWHPEQGDLDESSFAKLKTESWFDSNGFLLYELENRIAGFCWTKIHVDHSPPLGEIYAIAIDPDYHGTGLGMPMTEAGLNYLHSKGIETGMLYVESDNAAALRTYEKIGFTHFLTTRALRYCV